MQRRISSLVAIGLLAFLAACGGGGGSDSPPPPPPVDTTPNTFTFTNQSGTALAGAATSDEVVITGISGNAAISITGGEYSINGGAFTSAAGTVSNGQRLQVRVNGAGQFSTPVSAVLTVGGVSATFTATTLAADTTPDAFAFSGLAGAALSTLATSSEIAIAGLNTSAAVTITGGEYSINGGAFTAAAGTVVNGQTLRVRLSTSGLFSTQVSTVLTVGTVSVTFAATTLAADTTPDAFTFASLSGTALSCSCVSGEIVVSGLNTSAPVSISGGQYSINGGTFTADAGSVVNGQRLRVRLSSSGLFSTAASAMLTVGDVSATFTVTTLAADTTPDPFQFARKSNGTLNAWVSSDSVAIAGINTSSPVSIDNGEYSVAGGAFTSAAGSIGPGQSLVVRARASSVYSKSTRARVTVGTVSAEFEVAAGLPDYAPDIVAWDGQDIVYLLSNDNRLIFRWSVAEGRYLDPYAAGFGALDPTSMAYSNAHRRVYLGYDTGAIRYIDVNAPSPVETAFTTMSMAVTSLSSAGNFLLAQTGYNYGGGYILNSIGTITGNGGYYYGYSRETAWDPVSARVYYFRDGLSPNNLHFDVIDQTTGQVTSAGESPYHGAYSIQPPIRVSNNGQLVLIGSGDIYSRASLNWSSSVGAQVADARWLADGSMVTLTTVNDQTLLRRRAATTLATLEQVTYAGTALRIVGTDTRMAVLLVESGTVHFHIYVPNDDSDADGVTNTQDAFPHDPAASADSDRDGYPDAWNTGMSQGDSTTGLTVDAFPQDAACYLAAHGSGGVCNYGATVPAFVPDKIEHHGDMVYLLSSANRRVYRWSISAGSYVNPYVVEMDNGLGTLAPTTMAYSSAQQRLYLGYGNGAIRYINVATGHAEVAFGRLSTGVASLSSAGNFLLAQSSGYNYNSGYIFNSSGVITGQGGYYYGYSRETAWDPVTSRIYYTRDGISPNDLHYDVINQTTGVVTATGETPYHGDYGVGGVIRVSASGQHILLGTGDIYGQATLQWAGSVGTSVADARWFANGSVVTLSTSGNQTNLRRLNNTNLAVLELRSFSGEALRVVGTDAAMVVLVNNGGTVQFHNYVPNDDSDGDGVTNTLDAFPLDRAASVDTDGDGYPDAWNSGMTQGDSTTGLTLDAFPNDSACYLASHGSGGVCNYAATIPSYLPDKVVQHGDVIYLLSRANRRVYRWSISGGAYLNPYVVGLSQGFNAVAPTTIEYSVAHQRLYLGYGNGAIRYIPVNTGSAEVAFVTMANGVTSLSSAGNFLVAQAGSGFILNNNGVTTANGGYYYGYSRETAWDPVTSRLYYTRDGISPNDLHYDVINQTTGTVTSTGETPYHGSYSIGGVVRVSANGQYILLGVGDIYSQAALTWAGNLGAAVADARWLADGSLVTLTTANNQTLLRRLGSTNLATLEQVSITGTALRLVGTDAAMVVLVNNNGNVQFHSYVPDNDSDDDGVQNTQDAFPLDPAASVDTDRDGYPDAWNAGMDESDSTTGLTLDAFPQDSACWLAAHGSGGVCNYAATIPNYIPDKVVQHGDVVYLLSSANRRVYRWSIGGSAYLNPYIVGINQGFTTAAPATIEYSVAHQRLYLGYSTGAIRYIDVNASAVEVAFATVAAGVTGLTSAGNYLVAHASGDYAINGSGVVTDQESYYYYGSSTGNAWDPVNSRVYAVGNGYSSGGLHYVVLDQATGLFGASGTSTYYNSNNYSRPPIRVSANGQYVLIGNGDIYAQNGLTWSGSLGTSVLWDARWMANGTMTTLVMSGGQTVLRRLNATNLGVLEQRTYPGEALRVVGTDAAMVVLVINNGTVQFHGYVPNDDSDGDGVTNTLDAFPLDRAASVDTDGDGYPDAWNPGRTQSDSTTGLILDAFPQDSACWLSGHGSGGVCNYGATIPNYTPDQIAQRGDTVYLLSSANRRVYRWSISAGAYLNPYIVGNNVGFSTLAPTTMAYSSAQQRLYLGYSNGVIRYIDVTTGPAEVAFATMSTAVGNLSSAGNFLLAQPSGYSTYGGYIYNSSGIVTGTGGYYYGYSRETSWDPGTSRIYYTRDGISPNDLHYDVIDQATGLITATGETPYHGSYDIRPPIRVSANGQFVLLGSGDIYNQNGLTWGGSLGSQIADARWFADGSLVSLMSSNNLTTLRRLGAANLAVLEQLTFNGTALRVLGSDSAMVVLSMNNGTVQFRSYVPNDDSDADGVTNTQDAFPLDRAASVDSDHDGYPDAWNPGRSQADSNTGLSLDAFPQDAACWLTAHGSGGVCNYGATIPNYVPDHVVSQGDIVYLLSNANRRVYRWSIATGAYLNPYIVGINQGFSTIAPTKMAYSETHQRLYFGYETGAIRYIDANSVAGAETPFANVAMGVGGLAAVGNFLLAQDGSGAWATHYVINSAGIITDQEEWNHRSADYAWDPGTSRVYWFSMWSPPDLNYEVIDQLTGQITGAGESPYHGTYSIQPPIRLSTDGQLILLGSGDFYNQAGLTFAGSLGKPIKDAKWKDNLLIDVDTTDRVEIRDANSRAVLASYQYLGQPLRLVFGQSEAYLVHVMNNTTAFVRMPFYDQDVDSIPRWWEQLYGLSDTNAGDASGDVDGDGVSNLDEYVHRSNPQVVDTDADGLTDSQEIVTYLTDPARADTDGDGLTDHAEITTHHSDPRDTDSDNDGFTDFDEVLYGGDPNDPSGLPQPIVNYSQTFENTPDLSAWSMPPGSSSAWTVDLTNAHAGSASLESGLVGDNQYSSVRFRGFFTAGQLSYWARVNAGYCCNYLVVMIDGVQAAYVSANSQWTRYSVSVPLGIHEIEWRYVKQYYGAQGADTAWIDDVVFAGQ